VKGDDRQEGWHLFLNAVGFCIAAEAILEKIKSGDRTATAALYVLSVNAAFSIELCSKAFILERGGDEQMVKALNHDLVKGIIMAEAFGLEGVTSELRALSLSLDEQQVKFALRYPRNRMLDLVDETFIVGTVKNYLDLVNQQVPNIGPV
jgi:hypothetical protein